MQSIRITTKYLRSRQNPAVFYLHITIILLVLGQLLLSNFIKFNEAGEISKNAIYFYGTWAHIITGLFLALISAVFITFVLKAHEIKNFFPYLHGDYAQVVTDINKLKQLKLPEPNPGGLASIVQGLGLGALILVLFSGSAWFVFWRAGYQGANVFKEMHGMLTGLVITYIIGHGGMGVFHILSILRNE